MQDTGRVGRAIISVLLKYIGEKLGIIIQRYIVKAIYWQYIKDKLIIDIIDNIDMTDGGGEPDNYNSRVGDVFYS